MPVKDGVVKDGGYDRDRDALTVSGYTQPSHGQAALNANGSFTYTPDKDWNGTDSFKYRLTDGKAKSNWATVTIKVRPVNDAPVADDDDVSAGEDMKMAEHSLLYEVKRQ